MDLLALTQDAFQFLQDEYGFAPPSLKYESRDKYDYVLFKKDALDVAVIFWSPHLPSVSFTHYPSRMNAPTGRPYFVEVEGNFPFHKAATQLLVGWWVRRHRGPELKREIREAIQQLAEQVQSRYKELLQEPR